LLQNITNLLIAYGPLGILLLAFVDSAGIPVANGMDALVILLSAKNPAGAPLYAAVGVLGSAAGNLVLYWVARHGGRRFLDREAPAEGRSGRFRNWFRRYGLLTVFIPGVVPIPLPMKVFVISAAALGVSLPRFMGTVVVARIIRYGGEAWLGAMVGEHSTRFISEHIWHLTAAAVGLFLLLYLWIRHTERRAAADAS
jgi:membrane protein YqaA with SNARE-associated domain